MTESQRIILYISIYIISELLSTIGQFLKKDKLFFSGIIGIGLCIITVIIQFIMIAMR